ncbi:MAG: NADH:flavin oxidoreductase/NADH oxidase [Chitinophagaceae bacterium]|nr:NADH:flavin oxidoreductase/NADH oxidase [Oligoflexus sp.]
MPKDAKLFSPFTLRDLTFKNRIFVSPMCQYSAENGVPNNWHLVHLGSRAVGGAAMVMAEATAVRAEGRISPADLGLWNEEQVEAFKPITQFIREQGAIAAVQLAHAGRKASTPKPWETGSKVTEKEGGWIPEAPSAIPFSAQGLVPRELPKSEISGIVKDFAAAAKRAEQAGFQVVELHAAHGYLMHEFLSPLANKRTDEYGGSLENRMRFTLEVARAVRDVWPAKWPVLVRISATDWAPSGVKGWDLEQSIILAKELKKIGIDMIDCSSGGTLEKAEIPVGPGYQTRFAAEIRKAADIPTTAVGIIIDAIQAEFILRENMADSVSLARELLRDPYFPLRAAKELGVEVKWPKQYERAKR